MDQHDLPNDLTGPVIYNPTSDEKTLGILAHALTFVASFLAPLIIYLIKKEESKYVADQAKESLNFQLTVLLAVIVLCVTIIGILLVWPVSIVSCIFIIIASIRASEGKIYRYPLCIRFIK